VWKTIIINLALMDGGAGRNIAGREIKSESGIYIKGIKNVPS
jgi:hypothetical protein